MDSRFAGKYTSETSLNHVLAFFDWFTAFSSEVQIGTWVRSGGVFHFRYLEAGDCSSQRECGGLWSETERKWDGRVNVSITLASFLPSLSIYQKRLTYSIRFAKPSSQTGFNLIGLIFMNSKEPAWSKPNIVNQWILYLEEE